MAIVTNHGKKRVNERTGINKNQCQKMMKKVLREGVYHNNVKGDLRKFFDLLYLRYHKCNNLIFWGDSIFLFKGRQNPILITVIPVPQKIMNDLPNNIEECAYEMYRNKRNKNKR